MKPLTFPVVVCCTIAVFAATGYSCLLREVAKLPRISPISIAAVAERQNTWSTFAVVFAFVFTMTFFVFCLTYHSPRTRR